MKKITVTLTIMLLFVFSMISWSFAETNNTILSNNELETFTKIFNTVEYNGFLQSEYSKASEIDLNLAFRQLGKENIVGDEKIISEDEEKDLLDLWNQSTFYIPVFKLTTEEIETYYETVTGEKINNISSRLTDWTYLEKYDAYYNSHGDSSAQDYKAIYGEKTPEGIYKIVFECSPQEKLNVPGAVINGTNYDKMIVSMKNINGKYVLMANNKYIEKVDKDNVDKDNTNKDKQIDNKKIDNTTIQNKTLPKTGGSCSIIVSIIFSIVVAIVCYKKYYSCKGIK